MITTIIKRLSTQIKLIKLEKEAKDTYTFKFLVPPNIKWTLGSYAHFVCSDLQNGKKFKKDLLRELSIMSHPDENFIGFTTRIRENSSEFKSTMLNLKLGDEIRIFKIGNHLKNIETDKPIVFISMGVGIATFRPIIHEHMKSSKGSSITNINIDRTGDFVYQQELENLSKDKLKNVFVTNRSDLYNEINQCLDDEANTYYVVGSKEFNETTRNFLLKNKVSKKAVFLDK
ncbi:FAD-dependent oxidoreductase [Ancylomarina sp. 16SWW S1-10-2]|uniref:FAD-dependent oxidoreductase n=1 Tax=Ancylomarina sp. 16SWW S1-10-2 TaxID=2499681 RepID=UPI0012ADA086|nr:FAD-dependent oxidoreductase [Ancylomarina sp. 16SWW S1-10-2]MRT92596.1 FAD-dependent oxidoreductase [Ancylomarina sp. 16SWW S1-10-2]